MSQGRTPLLIFTFHYHYYITAWEAEREAVVEMKDRHVQRDTSTIHTYSDITTKKQQNRKAIPTIVKVELVKIHTGHKVAEALGLKCCHMRIS
jgi:hypothetical protein